MKRLQYIDAMRGFTIVLVVYSHVLAYLVDHTYEDFNFYFLKFRMPLFFFISGFFVYSRDYSFQKLMQRTKNRFVKQLYPTIVIGLIFCFTLYSGTLHGMLYSKFKGGYWFTLVAVEAFLLIAPLLFVMNSLKWRKGLQTSVLLAIIVSLRVFVRPPMLATHEANLFSLIMLYDYLPFFILGILFRINEQAVAKVLTSFYTLVAASILFFCVRKVVHYDTVLLDVEGIAGVCMVYYVFALIYRSKRVERSRVSQALQYAGRNTLEIYLLHYFVIMGLARLVPAAAFHALRFMRWEFPAALAMALAIAAFTLFVAWLLRRARLYKIIFAKD